jgi:ABC-type multidrug transport system fused ATPase/permease subunit
LAQFAAELRHLPAAFRLVRQAAPGWTVAWLLLLVLQGLLPVAAVYLTKALVDSLASGLGGGAPADLWPAVLATGLGLGVVLLFVEVLPSLSSWVSVGQSELLRDRIQTSIHQKSVDVDLAFYDTPEFYDHLYRARDEAGFRPVTVLASFGSLLQSALTLVAMAGVLLPFGMWLPAALVAATLPALWVVLRHSARLHEWRRHGTARERRARYYDWLLTSGEAAAEVRIFDLGARFRAAFADIRHGLRRERLALARAHSLAQAAAAAAAMAVAGVALLWTARWTIEGRLSLGELAMLYQAFFQGLRLMRSLLESAGQFYANILFLGSLFEFFELRPALTDPADPVPVPPALARGIRFSGVVFQYPGAREPALRGLDLDIAAGGFVAIVGPNGAGTSTLVRLLCRLYDPGAGAIEVDGRGSAARWSDRLSTVNEPSAAIASGDAPPLEIRRRTPERLPSTRPSGSLRVRKSPGYIQPAGGAPDNPATSAVSTCVPKIITECVVPSPPGPSSVLSASRSRSRSGAWTSARIPPRSARFNRNADCVTRPAVNSPARSASRRIDVKSTCEVRSREPGSDSHGGVPRDAAGASIMWRENEASVPIGRAGE